MRCPACGYISFDHLPACKQCGAELPRREKRESSIAITTLPAPPPLRSPDIAPPAVTGATGPPPEAAASSGEAGRPGDQRDASLDEPPATDPCALPRAGFWLRGVAFLGDIALVVALCGAGGILVWTAAQIGGAFSSAPEAALDSIETRAMALLTLLIHLCYFSLFVGWRGQTPGKMLLGLKIIRITGEEVGYARALVRWLAQGVGALLFGMGFLMVAFSRKKQGLHDKLAGTYVVRLPP